ncbi:Phosphatidylserine decarboxylase [Chondrus crispus]|uniref:phosphatidylserine decarboxylase n=1 Tax=Chondrus crispus TaxID=2769 RepID=R7QRP3_CHOCR|nr:Phosphatidylserine decarboxylase [Chondrus crispus]CDF41167.1 Phosphatidylserine decarboxylase [Chondrus crispus]|eukprot:XP_005711461.1 Phosphatidylserine decarboxylase [Chondrus crispus]
MRSKFANRAVFASLAGISVGVGALSAAHWSKGPKVKQDASLLRKLPLNLIGMVSYYAGSLPIPVALREPAYKSYCSKLGCDVSEVAGDLRDFRSLSDFFARNIASDFRPIDKTASLVAPCDGTVIAAGPVGAYGSIEVKNITYCIRDLLGAREREPLAVSSVAVADRKESGARLWYTVIHIEPGQCHRFASPTSWSVSERTRIGGYLLWLNPDISGLYTENERLAMLGEWDHGLFCLAAVGAAGRGSIYIDKEAESFQPHFRPSRTKVSRHKYHDPRNLTPGQQMGGFKLGSAIVLVFEAPEQSFKFHASSGERVRLGQKLATVGRFQAMSPGTTITKRNAEANGVQSNTTSRARFRRAW